MTFTRLPSKGRTGVKSKTLRAPVIEPGQMRTFAKTTTTTTRSAPRLTGKEMALSHVKNATARAAISKSAGKTFPAGKLAAQAKRNVKKMLKQGGAVQTRIKSGMPKKTVARQRKAKR